MKKKKERKEKIHDPEIVRTGGDRGGWRDEEKFVLLLILSRPSSKEAKSGMRELSLFSVQYLFTVRH